MFQRPTRGRASDVVLIAFLKMPDWNAGMPHLRVRRSGRRPFRCRLSNAAKAETKSLRQSKNKTAIGKSTKAIAIRWWRICHHFMERLPKYKDAEESDVFILSGAEDLVPALVQDGNDWRPDLSDLTVGGVRYRITRYRPRIEGLFARIERWANLETGKHPWRSISKENIPPFCGRTAESRVADPADPVLRQNLIRL